MDETEIKASLVGSNFAVAAAISALIATHPDPTKLRQALDAQRQVTLSCIERSAVPEKTLDGFLSTWRLLLTTTPLEREDGS